MKLTITPERAGQRLDKLVTEETKDTTRSQIKKMIQRGDVLVNGKPAAVHYFVRANDEITIQPQDQKTEAASPIAQELGLSPEILFEDSHFLILNKPAGLLVHPTERRESNTLADWLAQHSPGIEKVGGVEYRGGIIHRLDRDVSGVMVAAKTNQAFEHLKQQFKQRQVKKIYTALVYGRTDEQGEIDLPIGRSKDGKFVAHPRRGTAKLQAKDKVAKTRYRVLEYVKEYSLLEVQILTGRTHQIRAHLSAIGHPIVGDKPYGPKKSILNVFRRRVKVLDPGRIFLHATQLGFTNLEGELLEKSASIPQQLTDFLHALKD